MFTPGVLALRRHYACARSGFVLVPPSIMNTFLRRGTVILAAVISLISLMIIGVAYASDANLTGLEFLHAAVGDVHSAIEGAAVRSGYDDTELHLAASIPFGALGAQLAYSLLPRKTNLWAPFVVGLGFGMLPGLAKEFYDATQPTNYFSTKDLGYDLLGSVIGIGITYSVHLLATHMRRRAPAVRRRIRRFGARMSGPVYMELIPETVRRTSELAEVE